MQSDRLALSASCAMSRSAIVPFGLFTLLDLDSGNRMDLPQRPPGLSNLFRMLLIPDTLHVTPGTRRKDYRATRKTACEAAGVPRTLCHDMRRSAARNLIRAGVPAGVVMSYTGHRSRSRLERYNITDQEHDHAGAAAKLSSYISAELSDNRGVDDEKPGAQVVGLPR
jgi:integrase